MGSAANVVIVGAGTGGIAVASLLSRRDPFLKITILDDQKQHYYQPLFTLVGGGVRRLSDCMMKGYM